MKNQELKEINTIIKIMDDFQLNSNLQSKFIVNPGRREIKIKGKIVYKK